ncbi:hypothetical protein AKJ37_04055 [candidate division MSBL1 archaeon SCGC-AAA259I09]|uniref:Transcription factor TFIIB cyclin-like domain-containing protein n=1 Tax=candidate division MSBL1 archaeon SCGC-AAA259I09 TaxID=1698267 RepID=A0A133URU1_9EURY|nr:hypothetical protein AKJ37_04055 [candidate division MSBL1 archaeon SCGC-AAA259I09]
MSLIFLLRVILVLIKVATAVLCLLVLVRLIPYVQMHYRPGSVIDHKNRDAKSNELSPTERKNAEKLRKWDKRSRTRDGTERRRNMVYDDIARACSKLLDPSFGRRNPSSGAATGGRELGGWTLRDGVLVNADTGEELEDWVVEDNKLINTKTGEIMDESPCLRGVPRAEKQEISTGSGVVVREGEKLFKKAQEKGVTRGANITLKAFAWACFHAACKIHGRPVLRCEIAGEAGVEESEIKRAYNRLRSTLGLSFTIPPRRYVGKIVSRLDVQDGKKIKIEAEELCDRVSSLLPSGSRRVTVAAVAVSIAIKHVTGKRVNFSAVAKAAGIDVATVSRGIKGIDPLLSEILRMGEREPQSVSVEIQRKQQHRLMSHTCRVEEISPVEAFFPTDGARQTATGSGRAMASEF